MPFAVVVLVVFVLDDLVRQEVVHISDQKQFHRLEENPIGIVKHWQPLWWE